MDNTWVSMMYWIYGQYMEINDVLNPINPIYMDNTWVLMMYWIHEQYMGINDVLNPINPIYIWSIHGY